ncbi:hypothetical protein [Halocatena salina]|uniref:Uncharacterized protein n=1 Tax=Halocatena salina TaxID=2934340 RepID=A0A8U0A608_9EURY|nr:hypothetical protein [Halocatena salina]UPM44611.1 hypothetical protein MW046_16305 [Halocatena salina]
MNASAGGIPEKVVILLAVRQTNRRRVPTDLAGLTSFDRTGGLLFW